MSGPTLFIGGANTIAVLALLVEFLMLRASLLRTQVQLYALQSLVVSALAGVVAASGGGGDLYALAGLSFLLKVLVVPWVVNRLLRDADVEIAGAGIMPVASAVLLAIAVASFGFFAIGRIDLPSRALPSAALSTSFAIVLVAFVLMILRNDVVSQAIGFFSLENGVSLASLVVAAGLPLILEVAFLFDLLVAVVVFGVLMRVHHRRARTLSTRHLTSLRG
jgi:hydrogenase-4 component E